MKFHYLSVGISKYQNQEIRNLSFAGKDAKDFFTLFNHNIDNTGYKKLLVDSEATLSAIRTALGNDLQNQVHSDDVFFFLFSGHGGTAEDNSNKELSNYLLPYDALPSDIPNSSISIDYLNEEFKKIKCKAMYVFIDSCFSGAINSKSIPCPKRKDLKKIKQFTDVSLGDGSVIFTASKADEEAIEDPEKMNGLFTYFLLLDLQKKRANDPFPVTDIFTPITDGVIKRAKEIYHHIQTPTANIHLEGVIRLPVFHKPLEIQPQMLEVPSNPELLQETFPPPSIQLSDESQEKALNELINFVISTNTDNSPVTLVRYEAFIWKILDRLRDEWNKEFEKVGSDASKIPEVVATIEGKSYQIMMLGGLTCIFGNNKQMEIFSEAITSIVEWGYGKTGLISLISTPEIILVNLIYIIGILCLARKNFVPLKILLMTAVDDPRNESVPQKLIMYNHIHYCDALGGNASKVNDHVREFLEKIEWIKKIVPKIRNSITDYQLQVNFLLSILTLHNGPRFWPDFGRFYGHRIRPIVNLIKYNPEIEKQIADLFNVKQDELRPIIRKLWKTFKDNGMGTFWWQSLGPDSIMKDDEINKK